MKKSVTIMDVARDCGLSKSTISYVLNGAAEGKVSLAKCELVEKSALKLGYKANKIARSLSLQKSYTIGVLLPSPADNFYGILVSEIQHLLSTTNYTPIFAFRETTEGIEKAVNIILSHQVDGIITSEPHFHQMV